MARIEHPSDRADYHGLVPAAFTLGLALSGFADGILLHQVLQWHHFLSLVPGAPLDDLRTQIWADGLFHVVVYILAACGLIMLWRARGALGGPRAGPLFAGSLLVGFGIWNMIDVGVFHWILGIHRIRVNVPNPMLYDLIWFVGLGAFIVFLGLWASRRGPPVTGKTTVITGVAALALAIPAANIPSADGNSLIIMRPGSALPSALNAVIGQGGRIVLSDPKGSFIVAALPRGAEQAPIYRAGALMVTRSPIAGGCLAFTKVV